jgi:hypothetical protein
MTKKVKSFCVFIISHGRADNVITRRSLHRAGYTGPLFIVIDNEDKEVEDYRSNFGEGSVIVFDKLRYAQMVDSCDNFQNRRTTTHARNACFDIAAEKGFDYFLVLDDDYTEFKHNQNKKGEFKRSYLKKADDIFQDILSFLDLREDILAVCLLQGGDLIGGDWDGVVKAFPFLRRKAMNSFFCKTSRRFNFISRLNEDVNTYLTLGSQGKIFMTIPEIALNQIQTQSSSGGMSDAYISSGTYVKSFYTVMLCPSFAKVSVPSKHKAKSINRMHHKINWNNAVPKIINESNRK